MNSLAIGWIGTGVMGNAMCGHMIAAGHKVHLFNRTRSKADNLVKAGADWCDTPREVARHCDVLFSIVGDPDDVAAIYLHEDGILAGARTDTVVVDMTTSSPDLAVKIHQQARQQGVAALDAPVSGGDVGAREATLAIMVGGDPAPFERVRPLLSVLGRHIARMGPAGAGQHTKMCNQILIAGTMIGVVESLLYAHHSGMSLDAVIDIIGQGAAGSWAINTLGRRIAQNDFAPGFYIRHFVKDMGIALAEARRMRLSLPGLALVHQFYTAAMAQGGEQMGTQGLYRVLDRFNRPVD